MNTHPAILLKVGALYHEQDDEPHGHTTEVTAYRPSYLRACPLIDHAGSHRQDGWRIVVNLSDGRRGYLTFSRRKLWRQEGEIDLGACDKVFASLVIEGEPRT